MNNSMTVMLVSKATRHYLSLFLRFINHTQKIKISLYHRYV